MKSTSLIGRLLFFCIITLVLGFSSALAGVPALAGVEVNVMPDGSTDEKAYTWNNNLLNIWGNVQGGTPPYTYAWDIDNDGSPEYSGTVTDSNNIQCNHAYTVSNLYEAKLTVTDSSGDFDSALIRIKVLPAATDQARIELSIERGLKWLYLRQKYQGTGAIYTYNSCSSAGAETAAAVLAFENRGHKPCTQDQDADGDVDADDRAIWEKDHIYAKTVHDGLDWAIGTLVTESISSQTAGNPDSNGNGLGIRDNDSNRAPYKIGMYMMALVGAGDLASGAPDLVATTGGEGVAGLTYFNIVQDMVDWCAWAQVEPSHGNYRGGWRYYANDGSSDNSACQWPAIGMEAAEFGWGCLVPGFVKSENEMWTSYSQYFTGYETSPYYYGAFGYTGKGRGAARTAAGMCQLSFQGKVRDNARIQASAKQMNSNKGTGSTYAMYALAKAARIAKIDTNSDGLGDKYAEIEQMDGWDWYETYSDWLVSNQRSDGSWYVNYHFVFSTAWAVEILTRNVFTLRPIAVIEAIPDTTPANSPVNFNIQNSFHQDSSRILTNWGIDADHDGTEDLSGTFPVTAPIPYPGYSDTGSDYSVTVMLRVTDDIGDIGEKLITVNVISGNVPPVADPGGPYNGTVGQAITFDGSASYDPNEGQGISGDHIVSWEWDLDGDGQYDDASGEVTAYTWSTPYQGNIGLKVTDDAGLSSTATVYTQVFVVDLWPENYVLTARKRVSRYAYEYTYQFDMSNRGSADASNVVCSLYSYPAQITVIDGDVSFGDIPGATVQTSLDTFIFREDRRYPVADFQITWRLEYDDAGGTHETFLEFPLR